MSQELLNTAICIDPGGSYCTEDNGTGGDIGEETQDLQQVLDIGNSANKPILLTGNGTTSVPGLYLGKNYIRSKGVTTAFEDLQIYAKNVQVVGEELVQIFAQGGQILVPSTGLPLRLLSTLGIEFNSNTGVPAVFNTRAKGLAATESNDFTTLSQVIATSAFDEQIVTTNGVINNLVLTSNLVRLTGSGVVLTGIQPQTARLKTLMLINDTGGDVNIQHLSGSSGTTAQLNVMGVGLTAGANVVLSNNATVRFDYSNGKWKVMNWFGDGYHPNLIGTGTRVVEVLPNGKEQATDSYEFEYFRADITTDQSDADLNALYPGVFKGTTVYCKNIVGGGMAFKKDDDTLDTWIRIPFIV